MPKLSCSAACPTCEASLLLDYTVHLIPADDFVQRSRQGTYEVADAWIFERQPGCNCIIPDEWVLQAAQADYYSDPEA